MCSFSTLSIAILVARGFARGDGVEHFGVALHAMDLMLRARPGLADVDQAGDLAQGVDERVLRGPAAQPVDRGRA